MRVYSAMAMPCTCPHVMPTASHQGGLVNLILQMDKLRLKKVIKAGLWAPKPMLPQSARGPKHS